MLDRERLKAEFLEMRRFPALRSFHLYRKRDEPADEWSAYFWAGESAATGHRIRAYYPRRYPSKQIEVKVEPDLDTHHKLEDGLCLMRPEEWNANWTVAAVILTAFRFLRDYAEGRVS